jgi:hypothetical protein
MRHQKLFLKMAALTAVAVCLAFACAKSGASPFWTEDFESYAANANIDGKDTTWRAVPGTHGGDWGYVKSSPVHGGTKSLDVESTHYSYNGYFVGTHWDDNSPGLPHGGVIELSWWMYVDTSQQTNPHWRISVQGWNDGTVAEIGNNEMGSASTVDYHATDGWHETFQTITPGSASGWHNVRMDVDFTQNPDQYRFVVDGNSWSPWITLGTDEQYLGQLNLLGMSGNPTGSVVYYDDFSATALPEPSTVALLTGAACLLALAWRRHRAT